ncbi:cadherin EGF LAG seven-pass G-type receptor 1-like isoform X2 [Asterias rubens]|uniref:cadherin EGF LAG seven-pass G-type receptor 1-like isoform X2 n=1 Tax=Asterias rubens TaxID=7604 RepID=UPI001455BEAA|nr:cadherin EGF LAG seven-pass G-type receptor 1-like isoform X2 [Asterias rubens]
MMALKHQHFGLTFLVIALVTQIEQHHSCVTDDLVTGQSFTVRNTNIEETVEKPHIGHLELENSKISQLEEDPKEKTSIPRTEDTTKEKDGTSSVTKSPTTNLASTTGAVNTTTSRAAISLTTSTTATMVDATTSHATISPTTSKPTTTTTVDTTTSRASTSPTTSTTATMVDTTTAHAIISPTISRLTVGTTTSRATIIPSTSTTIIVDTTTSQDTITPTTSRPTTATTVDTTTSRATISPTVTSTPATMVDTTTAHATISPTTSTPGTMVDTTTAYATISPTTRTVTTSKEADTTTSPATKSPKTIAITATKYVGTPTSSTLSFTSSKPDPTTFRSTRSPTIITATTGRAVDTTTTILPITTTTQVTISPASDTTSSPAANLYTPVFYEDLYYAEVEESSPVGTTLLTVQAMDWDEGAAGVIMYNISSQTPDGEAFGVHPETGVVALRRELDREEKGRYVMNVTATDKGQPQRMAVAVLEIVALDSNDNVPIFDQVRYESVVSEDTHSYSRVLHVTASDKDLGRNSEITYTLSGNHRNKFTIDDKSGLIRTLGSLDRERVSHYNFLVIATDRGIPRQEGFAEIYIRVGDVNDNPPKFPSDTIDLVVPENNLPFDLIGQVTATDADEGPNAIILYAFVQRVRQSWFQIDRRTGVVHTLYRFDREKRAEYEVTVRASSGRLFSDVRLVIHIGDENDNAPIVPASQVIFYNFYEGTIGYNIIGKVGALDKDVGDSLNYHLLASAVSLGIGDRRRPGGQYGVINQRVGVSFSVDQTTGTIYAYHQEPYSEFKPLTGHLTVNVSDGINSVTCNCTIYMKQVTYTTFKNSISMRLRIRSDRETFLSRHRDLLATIADIFRTDEELVTFLIRRGLNDQDHGVTTTEAPMLRVSLAVRRRDGTIIPTDELQSMIYLEVERLRTLVDMTPDSIRSLCLLRPTVTNTSSVVAPVALGLTYVSFNVVLLTHCQASQGSCTSVSCGKFEECLDVKDGFRCQCLFSGNGTCQPPFPAGTCPEAICNRRGTCTVDEAGEVNCLCRDHTRYDGPHCEMTTRSFTDDSFLAFKPLGRSERKFHITLRFKTAKPNGILLYNGPYLRGRGESIALQIVGGRLQFIKSSRMGTSVVSASIATDVSDGRWHDVYVNNVGGNILLGIDGCIEDAAHWNIDNADASCIGIGWLEKQPRTQFINLNGPLFLGGLPSFVTTTQVTSAHFEGCLNAVQFNSKVLDFSVRLKNVGTSPRCKRNETVETKVKVPRAVKSLSARSRLRSLVVKWSPPKHKSEQLIGYQLSHVEVNDVGESISDTWTVMINGPVQSSYTIERLTPNTRYKVTIKGYSTAGFGESSTVDATTKANRIR